VTAEVTENLWPRVRRMGRVDKSDRRGEIESAIKR